METKTLPAECVRCGTASGPFIPVESECPGWLCPKCYREVQVPSGYAETMDALKRPKDWDVPGMIADVCEYLRQGLDVPPGQVLAMVDTLMFRMKDIAELIHRAPLVICYVCSAPLPYPT